MSKHQSYPVLEVNLESIKCNAHIMAEYCAEYGISVAGVIKFSDGDIDIARAYHEGGCVQLASSRLVHLKNIKKELTDAVTMLIRLPMLSEAADVVKFCDISLNSERETLLTLNREAGRQGKKHSVLLMLDVGDLREGVVDVNEFHKLAMFTESRLQNLHLIGIGSSFACFGSIMPTRENLGILLAAAEHIEKSIGRKLEILSGGSSVSLALMQKEGIPEGINHLRIGGAIANPRNIRINRGVAVRGMCEDTFILHAELIEVAVKPTRPYGQSSVNWAGNKVEFEDLGLRKRAIAAIGSQDLGDVMKLLPRDEGVRVIGGSSDHMILDVEDSGRDWRVGDTVSFNLSYEPLLHCFSTRHVRIKYV